VLQPDIQAILDGMNGAAGPPAHEIPINEGRAGHAAETEHLCGRGEPVAELRDVSAPGPGGDVPIRVYAPAEPRGVIAYIHGGGWIMGTLASYDAPLTRLANASGATVASIDYRLAPEHRFPTAVDDCLAAIRWIAAAYDEPLVVAGDSAGGNLAAVAARRLRGEVPLQLQVLIYPVTDSALNRPSHRAFATQFGLTTAQLRRVWNDYLGDGDGSHPDASPLRAGDLTGVAPAFILTAEADVLRDEGEAYAEALRAAGVEVELVRWPGVIHGFWRWVATTKASGEAIAAVAERVKRVSAG
jgi:acetyl esterase